MEMIVEKNELGVTPKTFASLYPRLYHMAHEDAWLAIRRYGLLTTRSILKLWGVEASLQACVEKQIRKTPVELSHPQRGRVVIRDQKPMHENKLRRALIDCTTEEWCDLLNGKVFFWPCVERLQTHMGARTNHEKTHLVLTIDSYRLTTTYESTVTLCAMNSGNTIPFAQKRGKGSFLAMRDYPFQARRARGAYYTVAELTVNSDVPDILDFVISADYMMSSGGKLLKVSGVTMPLEIKA